MKFTELGVKSVYCVESELMEDARGYFMRIYDDKIFMEKGLHRIWVQESQSYSKKKGTIRGIHFQYPPYQESKLVRVISGKIMMVYVDLRKVSKGLGQWGAIELSAENKLMLFIPRGIALGFRSLTDDCTIVYKMDHYYVPEKQGAIRWDDPKLNIDWKIGKSDNITVSEKDANAQSYEKFLSACGGL